MAGLAQEATGAARGPRSVLPFVWATTCAAALLGVAVLIDTWGGASNPPPKSAVSSHAAYDLDSSAEKKVQKSSKELTQGSSGGPTENGNSAENGDVARNRDGLSNDAKAFRIGSEQAEVDKDVPKSTGAKSAAGERQRNEWDGPASKKSSGAETGKPKDSAKAGGPALMTLETPRGAKPEKAGEGVVAKRELPVTGASVGELSEEVLERRADEQAAAKKAVESEAGRNKSAKSKKAKTDTRTSGDRLGQPRQRARGGRTPAGRGAPGPAGPATGGPAGPTARPPGGPAGPVAGGPGSALGGGAGGPGAVGPTRRGLATPVPSAPAPAATPTGGRGRRNAAPAESQPQPNAKPRSSRREKPAETAVLVDKLTEEQRRLQQRSAYKVRFARAGRPAELLPLVTIEGLVLGRAKDEEVRTGSDDFYLGSRKDDLGGELRKFFRAQMQPKAEWSEQHQESKLAEQPKVVRPTNEGAPSAGGKTAPESRIREALEGEQAGGGRKFGRLTLFEVGPVDVRESAKTTQRARRKAADRGGANADKLRPAAGGLAEVPGRKEAAGPEYVERDWLVVGPQSDVQRLLAALRNHATSTRSVWRSGEARIAKVNDATDRGRTTDGTNPIGRGGGSGGPLPEESQAQAGRPEAASPSAKAAPMQRLVIRFRVRR